MEVLDDIVNLDKEKCSVEVRFFAETLKVLRFEPALKALIAQFELDDDLAALVIASEFMRIVERRHVFKGLFENMNQGVSI